MHGLAVAAQQSGNDAVLEKGITSDIIEDFTEISRAAFAEDETEAEGEAAYMELVEYVRVSVQLLFEEFHRLQADAAGPEAPRPDNPRI